MKRQPKICHCFREHLSLSLSRSRPHCLLVIFWVFTGNSNTEKLLPTNVVKDDVPFLYFYANIYKYNFRNRKYLGGVHDMYYDESKWMVRTFYIFVDTVSVTV